MWQILVLQYRKKITGSRRQCGGFLSCNTGKTLCGEELDVAGFSLAIPAKHYGEKS
jgi:hypothetical protein